MERNLKLTLEQARELYKKSEMKELLLTTFTKEELEGVVLKDWSELKNIEGCWITSASDIKYSKESHDALKDHRNIFATEKQAKSALAMAQLSQLMKNLSSECDVDWNNNDFKYCIIRVKGNIKVDYYESTYSFLAFKTAKVRDAFIKKHERLIRDYFMID